MDEIELEIARFDTWVGWPGDRTYQEWCAEQDELNARALEAPRMWSMSELDTLADLYARIGNLPPGSMVRIERHEQVFLGGLPGIGGTFAAIANSIGGLLGRGL